MFHLVVAQPLIDLHQHQNLHLVQSTALLHPNDVQPCASPSSSVLQFQERTQLVQMRNRMHKYELLGLIPKPFLQSPNELMQELSFRQVLLVHQAATIHHRHRPYMTS